MFLDYSAFENAGTVYTAGYARDATIKAVVADANTPQYFKEHPDEIPASLAWVEESDVPHADGGSVIASLYYAFCSQAYLDANVGGELDPPYNVDGVLYSHFKGVTNVPAICTRNKKEPFLPSKIDFLHRGKVFRGIGTWVDSPQLTGLTNALFNVDQWTNVGLLQLPLSFSLSVFTLLKPSVRPDLSVRISCVVTSAVAICDLEEFRPPLNVYATITDRRLQDKGRPLELTYSTNKWLTKTEVMSLPGLDQARILAHQPFAPVPRGRRFERIFVLIALVAVSFSFLVLLKKFAHKTQVKT